MLQGKAQFASNILYNIRKWVTIDEPVAGQGLLFWALSEMHLALSELEIA